MPLHLLLIVAGGSEALSLTGRWTEVGPANPHQNASDPKAAEHASPREIVFRSDGTYGWTAPLGQLRGRGRYQLDGPKLFLTSAAREDLLVEVGLAGTRLVRIAGLVFERAASPCHLERGPASSPEEQVGAAEVIVRAEAVRFTPATPSDLDPATLEPFDWIAAGHPASRLSSYGRVELSIREVLKGKHAAASIEVTGQVAADLGKNEGPVPYGKVRPGGQMNCFATDYRIGAEYLLFLREGRLMRARLQPVNEVISGGGDPWVAWVRAELTKKR